MSLTQNPSCTSAGPGLDGLPRDVACSILNLLPFAERHSAVPLVCQRWRALVEAAPELRREAALFLPTRRVLPGLRSLAAWLLRGASADVRCIRLHLHAPLASSGVGSSAAPEGSAPDADEELAIALAAMLATCSGPSAALRQLSLHVEPGPLVVSAQLAAALQSVPQLQSLSIALHCYGGLRVAAPLSSLPALQELSLGATLDGMPQLQPGASDLPANEALQARCQQRGWQYCGGSGAAATSNGALAVGLEVLRAVHPCSVLLLPGAALPVGLTRLSVGGLSGLSAVMEGSVLPCLRSLSLANVHVQPGGINLLARLPALRRLRLARCWYYPGAQCLAQLSSLQELHLVLGAPPATWLFGVDPHGDDDERQWQQASQRQILAGLPAIGGSLRHLVLAGDLDGLSTADLAPLAELHGLRSLCLWPGRLEGGKTDCGSCSTSDGGAPASFAAALPSGAWLRGLSQLAAPAQALAACQGLMQGACQLEALGLQGCCQGDDAWLTSLLHWAAAQPGLHTLCLESIGQRGGQEAMQRVCPMLIEHSDALTCRLMAF